MIKQGIVQESMADISGPANLPPLTNLPQWSRVNTLDKARYPKSFQRDRLAPLGRDNPSPDQIRRRSSTASTMSDGDLELGEMNSAQRILHLERSVRFLQEQHKEVLSNLHDEIDTLKRQNKELQFKIVILQNGVPAPQPPRREKPGNMGRVTPNKSAPVASQTPKQRTRERSAASATSSARSKRTIREDVEPETSGSQGTEEDSNELKIIFLEEEIKELKKSFKDERARNNYLSQLLDQAKKIKVQPQAQAWSEDTSKNPLHLEDSSVAQELPYNATIQPLLVHLPAQKPRPPNLAESQTIMKHLQQINESQAHELNQLKCDLRDVLYSHKWTPDAYLLAKAYVAEDDAKDAADRADRLPRIPLKQQSRKLPDIAYIQQRDSVMLPALKQTMGNKAIERRKRTQILQKARGNREVPQ